MGSNSHVSVIGVNYTSGREGTIAAGRDAAKTPVESAAVVVPQ